MSATPRDLLQRLFEYIEEQVKEIDPRGFHIPKPADFHCHPEGVAGLPGIGMDIQVEGDHIWLKVDRLEADKPPALPAALHGLCHVGLNPAGQPPSLDEAAIRHQILAQSKSLESDERDAVAARIRGDAEQALREYTNLWQSWAENEKPRRKTISLYGDLFALKHQLEAEETAKPTELVWGVGVATWSMPYKDGSFPFTYPVLTQAVEINLNEKTMALEVRPRATDTRVEMDAFVACQVLGAADVEKTAREHLAKHAERPVTPFDPGSYSDVLKLVAANLDSKGSYREILATHGVVPTAGEHLAVTDTWALFSRPRANNYLIEDLKRLHERIAGDCVIIPDGPLALVSPPSGTPVEYEAVNFRGVSGRGSYEGGAQPQELYFPLPYNTEQVTIVQRLERAAGVTVQGPPGTGKTHTIANIICHYLATGRRVLVTSRGEPALEVLQSKIPEEVRDLTVALLAGDREGLRQFQASIEAIQHQVSQINLEQMREQIAILEQAIDRAHAELSTTDRRVDSIANEQLSKIEVDGAPMRAQDLAELVVRGHEDYAWFDDPLSLAPEHTPPLTESEAGALRESRRKLGPDLVYVSAKVPSADDLPSPSDIAELHNVLRQMKRLDSQVENGQLLPLKGLTAEVLQAARDLLAQLDKALALAEELESVGDGWPMELRTRCRHASFASERQAMETLFTDVDHLVQARAEFLIRPVEFPAPSLGNPKVLEAVGRAAETGKPFGLLTFGMGGAKVVVAAVRVAGLPPDGAADWAHVQRYVALHSRVASFLVRWNQFAETLSVPRLGGGVESLREIELAALAARKAHTLALTYDATLPRLAEAVFEHMPAGELLGGSEALKGVRRQLLSHLTLAELSTSAATKLSTLQEKLAGKSGPVSAGLRAFVEQDLGKPELDSSRASARFAELVMELRRIAGLSVDLANVRDGAARIDKAGASRLAARVRTVPVVSTGDDPTFPVSWRAAWNWARMKSHLDKIEAREELQTLAARRRNLEGGLSKLYKDMVSKQAWLATKRNATPKVLQALAGYATAIRRIGMGTGPNAVRYRRDARVSMLDAAGAVPCWIMSHAKISESMPPDIGAFDLVIVDEASQSDLWALPAIVRGKKILVVGDDKQVSPDAGFVSSQRIDELKHRFLHEQPYGIEMTPEKSLYELAARVFAAEQVMLREHFRCVPPIIAYSNRVFYKNGIQPLRIPKGSERIDPPLVDIYAEGGMRDRHDCNAQEAEAIAAEIAAILEDERFTGRTLGVVSLLGMEQAKHIDALVRARCPAAELLHRKFECGDARTFQGSERDIIFLSMVVDPGRSKAVSGIMFEQRFNVAASRARDRMYLVRSVKASDLSDKDLRLTLLSHFDKPLAGDPDPANLIDLCESGFERDVFTHLTKSGYRVIPQVKSGTYRIDMVVEGAGDTRLAVECDGDEYHGPDRWQQDMNRQRVLERAGWTFWRCFASTWTLHKEEVFSELVERLGVMGIEPLGALERAPELVEKRDWKQHPREDGEKDAVAEAIEGAIAAVNQ